MDAVIATTSDRSAPTATSSSLKSEVQLRPAAGLPGDGAAPIWWNRSSSCCSAFA